jgi:hypothetical protein
MDLPEYGNKEAIAAALKKQEAVIVGKKAELKIEYTRLDAIRQMCEHEYYTVTFAGHYAGKKCEHCGDVKD